MHVGDSAFMGCVVHSPEEKHVVKVDWILSKGEHAEVRRWPDCMVKPLANGIRIGLGMGESVIESSG